MSLMIAGIVIKRWDGNFIEDEGGRVYSIPSEIEHEFEVDEISVVEIIIPLAASIAWDGRVVTKSKCRLDEVLDNHLYAPAHPAIRKVWEENLEIDRASNHPLKDLFRATISATSDGISIITGFETRSVRAYEAVLQAYKEVFPNSIINSSSCVAITPRFELEKHA